MRTSHEECERARQWISAGLDGELSEFESVLLEGHLAHCGACSSFRVETALLTNELRTALLEPVEARIAPRRRRARVALRLSPAAASLAVVVGVGSILASVGVGSLDGSQYRRAPVSGLRGVRPMSARLRFRQQQQVVPVNPDKELHGPVVHP